MYCCVLVVVVVIAGGCMTGVTVVRSVVVVLVVCGVDAQAASSRPVKTVSCHTVLKMDRRGFHHGLVSQEVG